ncbi:MAG TPA: hypothetical protein EYP36_09950 [Calditrichaeota bacterium]|nr:hypothetical protein [Calditrichota bacterium]
MRYILTTLIIFVLLAACKSENKPQEKQTAEQIRRSEHRCANCGMITSNYPNWEEKIILISGDTLYFDGPRCLFFTLLGSDKIASELSTVNVKDYYTLKYIDAKKAYYVIGSNVLGPMGKELVPFDNEEAAKEFVKDHKGDRILRFDQVDLNLIKQLAVKMDM